MSNKSEEMVEFELMLEKEHKLLKMTKSELRSKFVEASLTAHVLDLRLQTEKEHKEQLEQELNRVKKELDRRDNALEKSEEYNEQARAMIEAIMERWNFYED